MRVAIVGYGNLGRGVEHAIAATADMDLVGIFSRRDPANIEPVDPDTPVYPYANLAAHRGRIDVVIACGGSKSDLPKQTPELAQMFNVVDSFDTHAKIPAHYEAVEQAATGAGTLSLISAGWDPGLFSIHRVIAQSILPAGDTYTFWGTGVSQGHSDAVRRVPGVAAAVQYTRPSEEALARVRAGEIVSGGAGAFHERECFVVLEPGADAEAVREAIVTMPDYFAQYVTTVNFLSQAEFEAEHQGMPHGGHVIHSGQTGLAGDQGAGVGGEGNLQRIEFTLALGSNPEFTASVLVAYARAVGRMADRGQRGVVTPFDVAPGDLSPLSPEDLRAQYL